jgi:hypothetical protein
LIGPAAAYYQIDSFSKKRPFGAKNYQFDSIHPGAVFAILLTGGAEFPGGPPAGGPESPPVHTEFIIAHFDELFNRKIKIFSKLRENGKMNAKGGETEMKT